MMRTHIPQRRTVLRGALAGGCTLMLWGCKAKQEESPAGTPTTATPTSETPPGTQNRKPSKAQAQYQDQPKGDRKCGNCMNFVAGSNTCIVVEGQVSPDGWCMFWVKAG